MTNGATLVRSVLFWMILASAANVPVAAAELKVSENHRCLLRDGKPFFYLCDTAWDLFLRLTREDADFYLKNRKEKGFNVVMAILIGEMPHQDELNAYGEPPLIDKDPAHPNEKYFRHVDDIVKKANAMGLVVAIAPAWSNWMYKNVGRGPHPFDADKARAFGEYVGRRYRHSDVIWVLGGDSNPEGYEEILRAMATGLDEGDGDRDLLITFHGVKIGAPMPPDNLYHLRFGSAQLVGSESWLDFHGAYSGHQWDYPTYRHIAQARATKPARPVIDLEPCYENHPYHPDGSMFHASPEKWDGKTRGTAALVRRQAYWALLAGAAGHTYAANDVWQFYDPARPNPKPAYKGNTDWRKAVDFPGAAQMGIMRRLFESRPWQILVPDESVLSGAPDGTKDHVQAARADDGSFLFAHLPRGGSITIALNKIAGKTTQTHWFNPREGTATPIGEFPCSGTLRFEAPSAGEENDWVLVLDDAAKHFPIPGAQAGAAAE